MSPMNNNQLHVSGWHLLAPRWKVHSEHWPEPPSEVTDSAIAVVCTNVTNGKKVTPSLAMIGGCIGLKTTASVAILNDVGNVQSANKWHNGPQLNMPRWLMGASVCNGYVYVLGGRSNDFAYLDTMERIAVPELFYDHINKKNASSSSSSWITLRCRLSEARGGCAAVTVHDRFILVMGGTNRNSNGDDVVLSSVDIIDTMTSASEAAALAMTDTKIHINNDEHQTVVTVSPGPNLQIPRYYLGAAVLNDHVWVVGGNSLSEVLNMVECFHFGSSETNYKTSPSMFSSSSWKLREDLSLRRARRWHGVAAVGQCLVVVGGMGHPNPDDEFNTFNSVELLDPQRGVVFEMLNMVHGVTDCTVMKMPNEGLIVIGRDDSDEVHMESLACVNLSLTQLKKYSVELESRQSCLTHCSVNQVSHKQQGNAAGTQLLRSRLESHYNSLTYYYLFHKGGHVPCVRKQQETEPKQSTVRHVDTPK